jgi:signal transduction histidine kinase
MKTSCFSFILWLITLPVFASPVDSIDAKGINKKLLLINHGYYLTTADDTPVEEVVDMIKRNQNVRQLDRINFGYNDAIFWIIVPVKNINQQKENLFLEIANPQIDKLQAYCVAGKHINKLGNETGDVFDFNTRYILHRNYLWPINACGQDSFYLIVRVDKRNTSLDIPVSLITESNQRTESTQTSMFYGISFGMMLLVIIYSIALGITFKERLYFIYALLVLNTILFLATTVGLSFQFIYPNLVNFNNTFRVIISLSTTTLFIIFSREFLNTAKYIVFIDRVLLTIALIFVLFISVGHLFNEFLYAHSEMVLRIMYTLTTTANLTCLLAAILTYPKQKSVSVFFIVAYALFVSMAIIAVMEDFGWIETFPFNILFIGALAEIIVFSFGLTYRIKKVYDERNELSARISRHQKEMLHAYVQGIEKERERIAGELHDDIGSRLGNLRRMVSQNITNQLPYIESQLNILGNDIRNLSHRLSPAAIKYIGLTQLVTDLLAETQKTTETKFNLQHYDVPDTLPEEIVQQTYRVIQEALQNIVKHAHATEADIQIFCHKQELVVTIEDNGRGFELEATGSGLGISQMRARTEAVGGQLEISASPGKGTQLMINIPL